MNEQDKEIVNSILSAHKKREPRGVKLKDHISSLSLLMMIILAGMIAQKIYGFSFSFIYSVGGMVFIIILLYAEYSNAKVRRSAIWKQEYLGNNDFILLSKCSSEFKDKIKEKLGADGTLMYCSLQELYRTESESEESKSKRLKIESILK